MKKLRKILFIFLLTIIALVAIVLLIRFINGQQNKKLSEFEPDDYLSKLYEGVDHANPLESNIKGVTVKELKGNYINGYHLLPDKITHKGAIIVFGGSEGSSNFGEAAVIAKQGYEVYSMYFFGRENQQPELINVPLDFFEELSAHIQKEAISAKPLTLYGGSKGAELSLLLASKYPEQVDNLVLYAPSAYAFQGISYTDRTPYSSWTYGHESVPYISTMPESHVMTSFFMNMLLNKPMTLLPLYESAVKIAENKNEATINLNTVNAKILIFAGGQDQMWQSATMAKMIDTNYSGDCELHIFENAGHLFLGPSVANNFALGGEYQANRAAKEESDKILFSKLEEWTK